MYIGFFEFIYIKQLKISVSWQKTLVYYFAIRSDLPFDDRNDTISLYIWSGSNQSNNDIKGHCEFIIIIGIYVKMLINGYIQNC